MKKNNCKHEWEFKDGYIRAMPYYEIEKYQCKKCGMFKVKKKGWVGGKFKKEERLFSNPLEEAAGGKNEKG